MGRQTRFPAFLRTPAHPAGAALTPGKDVVFHHLPKTAGSTFRRILENLFEPDEVCTGEIDDEIRALSPEDRRRCRLYAGHFTFNMLEDELGDAVWLTFLRNPIDRVVSNFFNLTDPARHKPQWIERVAARPAVQKFVDRVAGMDLEEFVFLDDVRAKDRVINRQTRYLVKRPERSLDESPVFEVYDEAVLEEAKQNLLNRFAFVGVQEQFARSLQLFALTFGLRPLGDISGFNANLNPKKTAGEGYDIPPAVREHLEAHNRMDLELWRFGQEVLNERLRAFRHLCMTHDAWHVETRGTARTTAAIDPDTSDRAVRRTIDTVDVSQGFHRMERDDQGRCFCWSGYEDPAIIELELPVADGEEITVTVEFLAAIDDHAAEALTLTLDDLPVDCALERDHTGGGRLTGRVRTASPAWPRRHHAIKLFGPRSIEPEGVPHRRLLGVAVHAAEVAVAQPAAAT